MKGKKAQQSFLTLQSLNSYFCIVAFSNSYQIPLKLLSQDYNIFLWQVNLGSE